MDIFVRFSCFYIKNMARLFILTAKKRVAALRFLMNNPGSMPGFFRILGCRQRIEFVCAITEFYLERMDKITLKILGKIPKVDLDRLKPALKPSLFNLAGRYTFLLDFDFYHSSKLVIYRYLPYDCLLMDNSSMLADLQLAEHNPRIFYRNEQEKEQLVKLFHVLVYNKIIGSYTDSKVD